MIVFREVASEICVSNGEGLEEFHVGEEDGSATGGDVAAGEGEVGEIFEVAEPNAGEFLEGVDGGEGAEVGGEGGGEVGG